MLFKFPSVIIVSAEEARANVAAALSADEVGRAIRAHVLELATPLAMADRIGACGLMPGDRVGILVKEPRPGPFPTAVMTGGREVHITIGSTAIHSQGKPSLIAGVPDPASQVTPDIDLRLGALGSRVALLPDQCAAFIFDHRSGQWYLAPTGGARVLLDDYSIGHEPLPLSGQHSVRFFTPLDDVATQPAVAQLRVAVERPADGETLRFASGPVEIHVRFGVEIGPYTLRASDNVRVGQLADGLARQAEIALEESAQVIRLRLAKPELTAGELLPGEALYAPRG